ncbi:MAG: DUF2279 domain-containing protein [Flavobacteriales bacterium]|nr:DUF2279 domain-containing protein [Flavobacteriales bacterium]
MREVLTGLLILWLVPMAACGQDAEEEPHPGRLVAVAAGAGVAITGSLVALDQAWFEQYEQVPFQTFNDGDEWYQMDKAGHVWSAYTLGRYGKGLLDWCGTSEGVSRWVGGGIGLVYLTGVELMDGRSAGWGFSWWDMAANVAGTGLFIGQDLAWGEQRIVPKFSAHLTHFAEQRPDLLGETVPERLLKDYNGQTYWLSVAPRSFSKRSRLPAWLCISAGYGAEGMVSAYPQYQSGDATTANGDPFRQYFLSLDVDLTKIPTRSSLLRTVLFTLNCIKMPAPALEFRSNGRVLAHGIYF